ncbi:MAG: TorF family putative porin, partial [Xanthobacteraceae bacterium]
PVCGSAMNKLTAQRCVWRPLVRMLAVAIVGIAIVGMWSMAARAQQVDSATPPAPSTTAKVEPATGTTSTFDISASASITSDYNYRGYTLSDHRPSASTNFEATYNIFFAGINAASVQMPMLSQLQMTDYAGIRPVFGKLTVETGVGYFSYPGSPIDISYPEYYIAPSYALTSKLTVGANVYYAPDYSRSGAWENYNSIDAKYTFDSGLAISGELGRQSFSTTKATAVAAAVKLPDYTYWNFGFSYTYKVVTFDLRYFATTLSKQNCNLITGTAPIGAGSNGCDPAIIGTLSWSGNLSGVK